MRSRRATVPYLTDHFSEHELQLLSTVRECVIRVERLSEEFIENAIADNNFASEKKELKKLKTKKRRKSSEHRKRQKKRKFAESESEGESEDGESDEDFVVPSSLSPTGRRVLRSDGIVIENEFEPTVNRELFSCKNCAFVTNTKQNLLQHASRHKNICSFCQRQFGSNAECEAHLAESHTPIVEKVITYKCKNCKEYFTVESEYKNHLVSHLDTSSDKFSCCFCRALFAKRTNLLNHVQRIHVEYKCTFCDISAPKFDILERHCQTLHSYWGRPFECEYCDFKFAVFGYLQLHRSEYHAIEWDGGEDKCRFCHIVLGNKENVIQHLATHIPIPLFKCYLCEFCSNCGEEMKAHSKAEHSKPEIFAKHVETSELMEMVKELIKSRFNQPTIEPKQPRQKPTAVETREAIATILSPIESFDGTFEENLSVEVKNVVLEQNDITAEVNNAVLEENDVAAEVNNAVLEEDDVAIETNHAVLEENDIAVDGVKCVGISTLVKASEDKKREKSQKGKQNKSRKRKNQKLEDKQNNKNQTEENGNVEDVDPFEAETDVESEPEQKSRAIMSVDSITNRLYVNGLPVFDVSGNEVYVVNQFVERGVYNV